MVDDLQAINSLSDHLIAELEAERGDDYHPSHLHRYQQHFHQAERILSMYERALADSPEDNQLKAYLGQHLFRMAMMYYEFILPGPLSRQERTPEGNIDCAKKTCEYAFRALTATPNESPALLLADVFSYAGFFGSACYWLREAERIALSYQDEEAALRARSQRLELEADEHTSDPPITKKTLFPERQTPGLYQATSKDAPASTSSRFILRNVSETVPEDSITTQSDDDESSSTAFSSEPLITTPDALPDTADPMDSATPVKSSRLAFASLILGIIGLLTLGLTALPGLILGIVAISQIKKNSLLTGKGLATWGVSLSIVSIALQITIAFPVFAKARERDRQSTCNSNVRQLALAIQMYAQDNGSQFPGIDGSPWPSKIAPYLGRSSNMFMCPSDMSGNSGMNSYAMAGLLIRENGIGVYESQVFSPSEVGALCDAVPSEIYPAGRLIGGGGSQGIEVVGATIEPRHSKGAIVGYCDGHAKYFQGAINLQDEGNGAVRALYHALPLGLVSNPVACLPAGSGITGYFGTVTVGGEYATYPFLMAAANMYGDFYTASFKGEYYTTGKPANNWVWGTVSGTGGPSSPAIAYDALVFIVAKGSKIPTLPSLSNQTYLIDDNMLLRDLFNKGYERDVVQVYHLSDYCSTNEYVYYVIGNTGWGIDSIEVANDAEMVEKVANDPWGIGYCSSAYADPDRVTILGFSGMGTHGEDAIWPQSSTMFRWVMPTYDESNWPWKRSINVISDGSPTSNAIASALQGGGLYRSMTDSPLYTYGYWPGNY